MTRAAARRIASKPAPSGAGGFDFREAPFEAAADPRFLYPHAALQRVCAELLVYHLSERRGLFLIAGAPGTGKSILLADILEARRLGDPCVLLACRDGLSFEALVEAWGAALGLADPAADHAARRSTLHAHLTAGARQGATLLLDRAETLPGETLRALGNLAVSNPAEHKPVRIVLAGRRELTARLAQPGMSAVKQAVAFEARLEALSDADVGAYVGHRLAAAGYEGEKILFPAEAIEMVARASCGVPRLINVLCRTALEVADATGQTAVSASQVETAIQACLQRAQESLVAGPPPPPPAAVEDLAAATARAARAPPAGNWPAPVEGGSAESDQARPTAPWRRGRLARAAARALAALLVAAAAVSVFPARTGPSETLPAGPLFPTDSAKARVIPAKPHALSPDPQPGSPAASVSGPAAAGARAQHAEGSSWLGEPADVVAPGDPPGRPRRPGEHRDR